MLPFLLLAACLNAPDLTPVAVVRVPREPPVVLVEDGRARLPIYTADGRRERQAAAYLAATIRDITGVKSAVYVLPPGGTAPAGPALRIAPASDDDAFRVITKDGSIRFLGRSDFAVYDWCERVLGVRHYGAAGRTFPRAHTLTVEAVDYADRPVFSCRRGGLARDAARLAKAGGTHAGGVNVHAPQHWFEAPDVRAQHPEIFARQPDGSRGEMPLLCYGNPETLAYYEQRIDAHIAGRCDSGGLVDTNRQVITVSHWDVRLECTCAHCRRLFDPSRGVTGSASPIIWGYFLKQLARWAAAAHPGYTISFLPYLNACDVPPGLDLTPEGNCEAEVCALPGLALFKEPAVREREERRIRDWARVTGRPVIVWHYGCWPREYTSAPYLYGRTIAAHYRRLAPYTVGSYICGGGDAMADALSTYVWHKVLWNPAVDVNAIYDGFAERMFGPAAPPLRRLMALQEAGWERPWPWPHCSLENTFDVSYPSDVRAEMKALLAEAAERAKGDAAVLGRVRRYAADFAPFFREAACDRSGRAFAPLRLPRTEVPPRIDGAFGDSCWTSAIERTFVPAFGSGTLVRSTHVRAVRTATGVAFAFRCREPAMAALNRSAAYGDYKGQDTLEIFIDASGTGTGTCHRLMFDVRGRMTATASDREWTASGVKAAVACDADEWRVEVFIPHSAFAGEVSRVRWRGNFTRWHPGDAEGRGRERSRLSTRGGEWNQNRDAFSDFLLE